MRIGLVGTGFMGRMHAAAYAAVPNATVTAVVCRSPQNLTADTFQRARRYASIQEMITSEELDAVDICLPTHLHAEASIMALNAGLNVICEKPMALNLEDADAMLHASRASGRKLMIAHCIRFWPEYVHLTAVRDSGLLGALTSLSLIRLCPGPAWVQDSWIANESLSGGAALDLHIHDVDFAVHLLGKPNSIFARGRVGIQGISHINSILTYGKTVVQIEGGWDLPPSIPFRMGFTAVFEAGAVVWEGSPLTVYERDKAPAQPTLQRLDAPDVGGNLSDLGGYLNEIQYFVDQLESGGEVALCTPESSLMSLATVLSEIEQVKEQTQ